MKFFFMRLLPFDTFSRTALFLCCLRGQKMVAKYPCPCVDPVIVIDISIRQFAQSRPLLRLGDYLKIPASVKAWGLFEASSSVDTF